MSSRPMIKQFPVIVDGDMSGNITSSVTLLPLLSVGGYSYSWSGSSPVGTVSIEISNDYKINTIDGGIINPGTWTTIYFSLNGGASVSSAPVSGNTGNGFIEWTSGAAAIRTKYTFTSGTGTLQSVINCKVA